MLFNSFSYALFLPIVFILYWIMPQKFRWIILLLSSYYFYISWGPQYVAVILLTTLVSYAAALLMEGRHNSTLYSRTLLTVSVIVCIAILFFFKYFNFFTENIALLFQKISIPIQPFTLKLALPIGISFYIFQIISYLIDVYRGDIRAERHLGIYAVYISFFPKVMQGPIERGKKTSSPAALQTYFSVWTGFIWPETNGLGLFQETGSCRQPFRICKSGI